MTRINLCGFLNTMANKRVIRLHGEPKVICCQVFVITSNQIKSNLSNLLKAEGPDGH